MSPREMYSDRLSSELYEKHAERFLKKAEIKEHYAKREREKARITSSEKEKKEHICKAKNYEADAKFLKKEAGKINKDIKEYEKQGKFSRPPIKQSVKSKYFARYGVRENTEDVSIIAGEHLDPKKKNTILDRKQNGEKAHAHVVRGKDGTKEYIRTIDGRVKYDSKKNPEKSELSNSKYLQSKKTKLIRKENEMDQKYRKKNIDKSYEER